MFHCPCVLLCCASGSSRSAADSMYCCCCCSPPAPLCPSLLLTEAPPPSHTSSMSSTTKTNTGLAVQLFMTGDDEIIVKDGWRPHPGDPMPQMPGCFVGKRFGAGVCLRRGWWGWGATLIASLCSSQRMHACIEQVATAAAAASWHIDRPMPAPRSFCSCHCCCVACCASHRCSGLQPDLRHC